MLLHLHIKPAALVPHDHPCTRKCVVHRAVDRFGISDFTDGLKGRGEIRWGGRLEFAAEVGPGDFVYFAPHVPHQEVNLDAAGTLDFVVVRSDNEKIVVGLDIEPVERPETLF